MRSTRTRRTARVAAAVAMALGLGMVGTAGAGAAAVDAAGWWWRPNSAALPIPVPPRTDVGKDQVLVEGEPGGATAIAAVRYLLAEGESNPVLTVVPTDDSVLSDDAVVLACRVTSPWVSASGGKWEARPAADCLSSVQGILGDDGKLVFALAPLQSSATLEVVLTPAQGSVLSLKFPTPTPNDLETTTDGAGTTTGGDFAAPDPASFGADSGSGDGNDSFGGGSSSGDFGPTSGQFSAPAFSQPSTFTPPAAVPAATAAPSGAAPTAGGPSGPAYTVAPVQAAPASSTSDTKGGRTFGVLVLLAGAALGFWAYSGALSGGAAAGAARGTEPVLGGLGRFARPRTGPPPTLG